jgi:L-threonylcarbamoyladenylate synthase
MSRRPTPEAIAEAAAALRQGQLVVMPTETVYGLAADALNLEAVARTFALKGRPAAHPLIVHWAPGALNLPLRAAEASAAAAFWPGPLTLLIPRPADISAAVTAGRALMGVRVPAHPVAQALLRAFGGPLTAPSANKFMEVSPTAAEHIDPQIREGCAMLLNGGPCELGIESTVARFGRTRWTILRPGVIRREQLEAATGYPAVYALAPGRAPGQHRRHYAPRARVRLVAQAIPGRPALTLTTPPGPHQWQMPASPEAYARELYAALRQMDVLGIDEFDIEEPPASPEWHAVRDRLRRAATPPDEPE